MGWKENKRNYALKYQKDFYATVVVHFNRKYDQDIIDHLNSQPNKNQYIKELVKQDMKGE